MEKRIIVITEKNSEYDRKSLAKIIRENIKDIKLNDIRIASQHIELDIFSLDPVKTKEDLAKLFKIKEVRILSDAVNEDLFKFSKNLFNNERFWEVHETLESAWRSANGEDKKILHGIILLAAAFVHYQKGRKDTSLSILRRAYEELKNFNHNYNGFDLELINKKIKEMMEKKDIEFFKLT